MNKIGLRKEEKAFETRVPIIPEHVKILGEKYGLQFIVEPSDQRAFPESEYKNAGAKISNLLANPEVQIILGIKEMPIAFFEPNKVYMFFSHTIKGQQHNMPLLQKIMDVGATLIDYECVVDKNNRRLIFFGNWAGMAGVSDTLRILGQRLEYEGIEPNPFSEMKPTLECKDLSELKTEFIALGNRINEQGLPKSLTPFVIGFAGYGNVSRGAQEIFDILPHEIVEPDQLSTISSKNNIIYKCVFKEHHMVEPKDTSTEFNLQDYYKHGLEKYKGIFEKYVPYLTVLMNCIYWDKKYPRLVTKEFIRNHWHDATRKLRVVGDISCDMEGAIEFTMESTCAENPAFTYIISKNKIELGVKGDGPVVMAVDNLPCELPKESSTSFSETLLKFITVLAKADFTVPFENLNLSKELKDAIIVYKGKLTKDYNYLKRYLSK